MERNEFENGTLQPDQKVNQTFNNGYYQDTYAYYPQQNANINSGYAYPDQAYSNQAYQNQTYQNQAYQNQTYQNQAYQNQTYQNQAYVGQGASYSEQAVTDSQNKPKIKNAGSMDKKVLIAKYMLIAASLLLLLAPFLTFSKIKLDDLSLNFSMVELVNMSNSLENNEFASDAAETYTEDYETIADSARNIADKVRQLDESELINNIISVMKYIPKLNVLQPYIAEKKEEILLGIESSFRTVDEILNSDSSYQIVDTLNICLNNRSQLITMIVVLCILGVLGILFVVFDKNAIMIVMALGGMGLFAYAFTLFEYMFISAGAGVYMILLASILYLVCGIILVVKNKKVIPQ